MTCVRNTVVHVINLCDAATVNIGAHLARQSMSFTLYFWTRPKDEIA